MFKEFTDEMKAQAINIAMAIDTGTIDFDYVLDVLKNSDKDGASALILFWCRFNEMTKSAIDRLVDYAKEKATDNDRAFLERCFNN